MKNVRLVIEFPHLTKETGDYHAAVFTGVMSRRHIYAKRLPAPSNTLADVDYVKIDRYYTKDFTSKAKSLWKVTHRSMEVQSSLNDDSRITINPELPDEIIKAIEDALEAEISSLRDWHEKNKKSGE